MYRWTGERQWNPEDRGVQAATHLPGLALAVEARSISNLYIDLKGLKRVSFLQGNAVIHDPACATNALPERSPSHALKEAISSWLEARMRRTS